MPTVIPESRLAEIADLECFYPTFGAAFEILFPGARQKFLDTTACLFIEQIWTESCRLTEAHSHAAAHRLTIFNRQNKGGPTGGLDKGPVSAQSMGPVSVSFEGSTSGGQMGDWSSTSAGRAYLEIRDELGPVAVTPDGRGCDDGIGIFVGGF